MKKTGFLAISLVALFAVGAARADIASTTYVADAISGKENVSNKIESTTDWGKQVNDDAYPSMATAQAMAQAAAGQINNKLGDLATKDTIDSADFIEDGVVSKAKLAAPVQASLNKADSAVQPAAISDMQVKANISTAANVDTDKTGTAKDTKYTSVAAAAKLATDAAAGAVTTAAGDATTKANQALADAKTYANGLGVNYATKEQGAKADAADAAIKTYGNIVTHNTNEFATAAQGTKADTAVQPAAISDMQVKANISTAANVDTDKAGAAKDTKYTSVAAAAKLATDAAAGAVTTAAGDATTKANQALADAKTYANGLAGNYATKAQGDKADAALPATTYNTQVGTVSATNMGTTATTVVGGIKEAVDEAAAAQTTANSALTKANAAIPAPTAACATAEDGCALLFKGGNYIWEKVGR